MEGYYCIKCKKFVLTQWGKFMHPDLGIRPCYICCKCGGQVCLREQEG